MDNPTADKAPLPPSPTVVVYQNADFVSGLLQEIYKAGLLQTADIENSSTTGSKRKAEKSVKADTKATVLPWMIGLSAQGGYGHHQDNNEEIAATHHNKFVYSQEYYLDHVRTRLRQEGLVTRLHGLQDASDLYVGDFIEFEARFEANEVNAILDILTPELTAAITRYIQQDHGIKEMDIIRKQASDAGVEIPAQKLSGIRELYAAKGENQAALAAAITSAIRADFRGAETKEFYASIEMAQHTLTAVTVCEKEYFKSKDSDRLLDGKFTVLGKVISTVREDVPILERNKLLSRLKVEALDNVLRPLAEEADTHELVDLDFKTNIEGSSITVLPIAIYV